MLYLSLPTGRQAVILTPETRGSLLKKLKKVASIKKPCQIFDKAAQKA
jgi:hypothetical protein